MKMPSDYVTKESCAEVHAGTCASIDKLAEEVKKLSDRLYKDNGHLSVQTRLDRIDRIVTLIIWILSVVGSTLLVTWVMFGIASVKYLLRVMG